MPGSPAMNIAEIDEDVIDVNVAAEDSQWMKTAIENVKERIISDI